MSKAEEKSLKAYPKKIEWVGNQWDGAPFDVNSESRVAYKQGYRQAEKDLELGWKDMELIYEISCDVFNEQDGHFYNVSKIWEEVLKRFNKEREEL